MGSGLCGLKAYDDIITDGKKQSAQEIQETLLKKKSFNKGEKAKKRERDERECRWQRGRGVAVGVWKVNYM